MVADDAGTLYAFLTGGSRSSGSYLGTWRFEVEVNTARTYAKFCRTKSFGNIPSRPHDFAGVGNKQTSLVIYGKERGRG
jgi:hypothetical protein